MFTKYKDSKRITRIELLRFIFAITIVFHHAYTDLNTNGISFYFFNYGAIAVEFFFILSGVLMAKSVLEKKKSEGENCDKIGNETAKFIKNKYLAIFPTHIIVFIILFIENLYFNHTFNIHSVIFSLPEAFLIQMSGIRLSSAINPNDWYISSMLLAMLIIYPLLRKFRGSFSKIIAPIITLCILGYMYQTTGSMTPSITMMMNGWFLKGTLRAITGICIGIIIYEMIIYLNNIELTKLGKILIRIIELSAYISIIILACTNIDEKWFFAGVFILAVGIMITFSKHSALSIIKKSNFILFLGDLSMTIFISQRIILLPLSKLTLFESFWINTIIFVVGTIIISVLIKIFIDCLAKSNKIKKLFILNN